MKYSLSVKTREVLQRSAPEFNTKGKFYEFNSIGSALDIKEKRCALDLNSAKNTALHNNIDKGSTMSLMYPGT